MGYSRKDIIGTSPLDYKNMNDNFKFLWLKTFGNIIDADLASNANINGAKIKAKSITADEIDATTLYVGTGGIRLDASATISWGQITGEPTIIDENTVTTISRNEISTATIRANQVNGGTITGCTLQTQSVGGKQVILHEYNTSYYNNGEQGVYIGYANSDVSTTYPTIMMQKDGGNGMIMMMDNTLSILVSHQLKLPASTTVGGSSVLTQATGVVAKFA